MKRFFISALEHSGDIAGAELVKSLRDKLAFQNEDSEFYGFGGLEMQKTGVRIKDNTVDNAIMGFTGVIKEIPRLLKLMHETAKFIRSGNFDAVIVIDAPDFNIRFAKILQNIRRKTKLVYFIVPQVWAWRRGRSRQIQSLFDLKFSVFPFETKWFRQKYVDVNYIGNPTAQRITDFVSKHNRVIEREKFKLPGSSTNNTPVIAILPGSRKSEIRNLLSVQIDTINKLNAKYPDLCGIIAVASDRSIEMYAPHLHNVEFDLKIAIPEKANMLKKSNFAEDSGTVIINEHNFEIIEANALTVMSIADAGFICSGTATLEAALLKLPSLVGYISNPINFLIARFLVNIRTISIANLVLEKIMFPELVQHYCTTERALPFMKKLLTNEYREFFNKQYAQLWSTIGSLNPFEEASTLILNKKS